MQICTQYAAGGEVQTTHMGRLYNPAPGKLLSKKAFTKSITILCTMWKEVYKHIQLHHINPMFHSLWTNDHQPLWFNSQFILIKLQHTLVGNTYF